MSDEMKKTIGILGGLGPEASANMYLKIIRYSQRELGAVQDYDYPPIVLTSLTVRGFDETGICDEALVLRQLIEGVQQLQRAGADFIIMACNTIHAFHSRLAEAVEIPIFHIIEEVRRDVCRYGYQTVGLLASESLYEIDLYRDCFEAAGVRVLYPDLEERKRVTAVIKNVMGGRNNAADKLELKELMIELSRRGAQAVVLGCTELPVVINQSDTDCHIFDCMESLARAAVDHSSFGH